MKITRALCVWALAGLLVPVAVFADLLEREPAFRDNFYDVVVRDQHAWVVGYYGTILHSGDRGATWTVQNSTTSEALFRIVFVDGLTGWASGSYGTLLHTRNGGKTWQKQNTQTEEHLLGLRFHDAHLGWASGSRGILLRTENGGASWTSGSVGEDIILNDVRFVDAKKGWVVGEFGRIYRTLDGGRTWSKHKSPIEVDFVSGESRNLFRLLLDSAGGWAFGLDGSILKTRGGERWEVTSLDGAAPPEGKRRHLFSAASFNGVRWAVGERGTLLVSDSGDQGWRPAAVKAPPLSLNGIAFGADGFGLIVGSRGLMLRTENGGKSWQPIRVVSSAPGKGVARPR